MTADSSEDRFHLLYLDWCSTQVARRFLELSLDEVWLRSHFAASLPADSAGVASDLDVADGSPEALDRIPGYLDLVRKTALLLAREMELPSFAEWKEHYLNDPDAFKDQMLGR